VSEYHNDKTPPVGFHAMVQPLVNSLHKELRDMRKLLGRFCDDGEIDRLMAELDDEE